MKLIVQTTVSNPDWEGCEFAFLDLTPELAQLILRRKASREVLTLADPDVQEIHYYGGEALFFDYTDEGPIGEACERCYGGNDPWTEVAGISEEDFDMEHLDLEARTECDRMVLGRSGFWWECYPKHCDPVVETREMPYAIAAKAAIEVSNASV